MDVTGTWGQRYYVYAPDSHNARVCLSTCLRIDREFQDTLYSIMLGSSIERGENTVMAFTQQGPLSGKMAGVVVCQPSKTIILDVYSVSMALQSDFERVVAGYFKHVLRWPQEALCCLQSALSDADSLVEPDSRLQWLRRRDNTPPTPYFVTEEYNASWNDRVITVYRPTAHNP